MKVTNEQIEALRRLADTCPKGEGRADELYALCAIAADGFVEGQSAIDYARARGLLVTAVTIMGPCNKWEVTPDSATKLLGSGWHIELAPDQEAVDAARDECGELIEYLLDRKGVSR